MSERNNSHLTRRGKFFKHLVMPAATVALISTAAGVIEANSESPSKRADPTVTCDLATMQPGETLWDVDNKTGVSYNDLQARHPGNQYVEKNPITDVQPGDIISVRIGAAACRQLHGTPETIVE